MIPSQRLKEQPAGRRTGKQAQGEGWPGDRAGPGCHPTEAHPQGSPHLLNSPSLPGTGPGNTYLAGCCKNPVNGRGQSAQPQPLKQPNHGHHLRCQWVPGEAPGGEEGEMGALSAFVGLCQMAEAHRWRQPLQGQVSGRCHQLRKCTRHAVKPFQKRGGGHLRVRWAWASFHAPIQERQRLLF